jgi:hypothetical protein
MADLNKVGEIYLVQDGDNITGLEVGFTTSVQTKLGAAMVLNQLMAKITDTAWTFNTIARVKDAQADQEPSEDSDTDAEGIEEGGQTAET